MQLFLQMKIKLIKDDKAWLKNGRGSLAAQAALGLQGRNRIPLESAVFVVLVHVKSDIVCQTPFRWCGMEVGRQLRSRPRHLT
ncbi:hypothetical protein AVEN_270700-1 [Araneus ventricosus]|uniref:Uncharacterized protein n=1 Tax=Araneus ventricosus TaxID=182803 RepID=A0A4Y2FGM5_ARAVE|nr:hypothetical protein AVEN_270700-1 [Araneus ventricosus]